MWRSMINRRNYCISWVYTVLNSIVSAPLSSSYVYSQQRLGNGCHVFRSYSSISVCFQYDIVKDMGVEGYSSHHRRYYENAEAMKCRREGVCRWCLWYVGLGVGLFLISPSLDYWRERALFPQFIFIKISVIKISSIFLFYPISQNPIPLSDIALLRPPKPLLTVGGLITYSFNCW